MVKKWIKLIGIMLLIFVSINVILSVTQQCFAASIDVTENPDFWTELTEQDGGDEFKKMIGGITSVIRIIGMIVSIVALMVIGIKYMIGSVEEKAQYKQTLFPWFIGAIMLFAITLIPTLLYDSAQELFNK